MTECDIGFEILLLNCDIVGKFRVSNGRRFHKVIAEGKKDFSNSTVLDLKEGISDRRLKSERPLVFGRKLSSGIGTFGRAVYK